MYELICAVYTIYIYVYVDLCCVHFAANCQEGEFQCADYSCINSSLRCDGKVDCRLPGGDEDGCGMCLLLLMISLTVLMQLETGKYPKYNAYTNNDKC